MAHQPASDNNTIKNNGVRNLLDLSSSERQAFIDSFDMVMTDCDGTIWHLHGPLPGTDDGVAALQAHGKRLVYLSNNAVRPAEGYESKFRESNIRATFQDVLHPGTAVIDYLRDANVTGRIYLIGSTTLQKQFRDAGFDICTGPTEPIEESIPALWRAIKDDQPVRAVVIDWDFNLSMKQLHRAQLYLRNPECLFVALSTDMYLGFATPIMGPGPFYKALEEATGRQAIVLGKPGAALRDYVLDKFDCRADPKRVLFVGDMLEQDIGFGALCGFQTLAVLSGAISEAIIQKHPVAAEVPDFYLPHFADFAAICKDVQTKKKDAA